MKPQNYVKIIVLALIFFLLLVKTFGAITYSINNIEGGDGGLKAVSGFNSEGTSLNISADINMGQNAFLGVKETYCNQNETFLGNGNCKIVASNLSELLTQSNTANQNIDMSGNDITGLNELNGDGSAIKIANGVNFEGNDIELSGAKVTEDDSPGVSIDDNGKVEVNQSNLKGRDSSSILYIGKYTPGCCDEATQPGNGNFTGHTVSWDSDLAMFGLRNYGNDRKDVVINNEETGDDIRFQSEGKDRLVVDGSGQVRIHGGNLNFDDSSSIEMGSSTISNIQMNNGHIYGANKLKISDPGSSEGVDWGSNQEIYSAPLDDSNQRGNLQYHSGNYDHTFRNGKVIIQDNNLDLNNNNIQNVNKINGNPVPGNYSNTCNDWESKGWDSEMHCIQDGRMHTVHTHTGSYTCGDVAQSIYDNRGYYTHGIEILLTFANLHYEQLSTVVNPEIGQEMYFYNSTDDIAILMAESGNTIDCNIPDATNSDDEFKIHVKY